MRRTVSLGERLLPYLLALLDACVVLAMLKGLASMSPFAGGVHVVPLWWLFVLPCLALGMMQLKGTLAGILLTGRSRGGYIPLARQRRLAHILIIIALFCLGLVTIWISFYAERILLFDPRWLMESLYDLQVIPARIAQLLFIAILLCSFAGRAFWLTRRAVEAADVALSLKVGVALLLVALLLRALARRYDVDSILLLDIPVFLFLGLLTHALALVAEKRREHEYMPGSQGSIGVQERALWLGITLLGGIFLLIAILIVALMKPVWIEQIFGVVFAWWHQLFASGQSLSSPNGLEHSQKSERGGPTEIFHLSWSSLPDLLRVGGIVLLVMAVSYLLSKRSLVNFIIRRRLRETAIEEFHLSVWSWRLFLRQLMALLRALWRNLFVRKHANETHRVRSLEWREELSGEPATRSIRETYRALLLSAFQHGCARRDDETAYEFQRRLRARFPGNEAALASLTDVYNRARYGGLTPNETDVEMMNHSWHAFKHDIH